MVHRGETAVIVGTPYEGRGPVLSRLVGPDGDALIVEPERWTYERLSEAAVGYDNVYPKSARSTTEKQTLRIAAPENPADHEVEDHRSETG